jgi:hypothetical protein
MRMRIDLIMRAKGQKKKKKKSVGVTQRAGGRTFAEHRRPKTDEESEPGTDSRPSLPHILSLPRERLQKRLARSRPVGQAKGKKIAPCFIISFAFYPPHTSNRS